MAVPRIIIADKSELARNLYLLLFAPLKASITVVKRFEALFAAAKKSEASALIIINSNIIGKRAADITSQIASDEKLLGLRKIFICRDSAADLSNLEPLAKLNNSRVIMRPFHPDEFMELVRKYLSL